MSCFAHKIPPKKTFGACIYSIDYLQHITKDNAKIQAGIFSVDFGRTIFRQTAFYFGFGLGGRFIDSDVYNKEYSSDFELYTDSIRYDSGWDINDEGEADKTGIAYKVNTGLLICSTPFTIKFDVQYNNVFGLGVGLSVGCYYFRH